MQKGGLFPKQQAGLGKAEQGKLYQLSNYQLTTIKI